MSSLTEADVSGNVAESEHKTISVTFDSSDGLAVCEQLVSDDAWLKGFGGRLRNAKRLLVHNVEAIGNWKSPRDRMQLMKLLLSTSVVFSTVARSEIGDLVQTLCLWFEHRGNSSTNRLRDLLRGELRFAAEMKHIWWGVQISTRSQATRRLEDVRLANPASAFAYCRPLRMELGSVNLEGIRWMIVGSDGKPHLKESWVLDLLRQCRAASIPFCFTGWMSRGEDRDKIWGHTVHEEPLFEFGIVPDLSVRRTLLDGVEPKWPRKGEVRLELEATKQTVAWRLDD